MTRPRDGLLHLVSSGRGQTVVLLHGVVGSHVIWDPLVPYLEEHYAVARVDLMGYGSSPLPAGPCTPATHVETIRRCLQHAQLPPPYTLIGLSMGANIALTFAAQWPDEVQDFVGIGLPYFASEADASVSLSHNLWTRLALKRPRLAAVALPSLWWALRSSGVTRWHRGLYTAAMAQDSLRVDYSAFRSNVLNCMLHYPYDTSLAESATMRRLFIHGSEDRWSGAEVVRQALAPFSASTFKVIQGEPHNVVVSAPAETAKILLDYLQPPTT